MKEASKFNDFEQYTRKWWFFVAHFFLISIFTSRGFAHSSVDALRPLPERPEESLPLSYIETVQSAISNFTPDTSSQSSPTTDNTPSIVNGLSESNTWSTHTGILTGRSTCSVNSWGNEDVSEGLSLVLGSLLGFIISIIIVIYFLDWMVHVAVTGENNIIFRWKFLNQGWFSISFVS